MLRIALVPPTMNRSNLVESYQIKVNERVQMDCPMFGTPNLHIRWLVNNQELQTLNSKTDEKEDVIHHFFFFFLAGRYQLMNDNRTLVIHDIQLNDNARYSCIGTNLVGELRHDIELQIFGEFDFHLSWKQFSMSLFSCTNYRTRSRSR